MTALEYAQDLIAFNSVSALSNSEVAEYVRQKLQELGFEIERQQFTDPHGVQKVNVLGKLGSGQGGIAYFAHNDVVPVGDWHSEEYGPFHPHVDTGKLYGRGACDMKGSLACMLAAAERIDATQLKQPIYITVTADEEVGMRGASVVADTSEMFQEMVNGDSHGIIGEPTELQVVYAHKGIYAFEAVSHGKAGHSSTREGRNANWAMIPYLDEMKAIYEDSEADTKWQNTEFDPPTVTLNMSINDHCKAANITPEKSVCTVYMRVMPDMDAAALVKRAEQKASECGLDFEILFYFAPLYVDAQSRIVQDTLAVSGTDKPITVSYCTDGALFTALRQMVVFGPGSIAQAHTRAEFITLEQLERGTDCYQQLIEKWCLS